MMKRHNVAMALAAMAWALAAPALAQDDQAAELAKKLSNPLAALISVPMQYNRDEYGGANDGATVSRLNIQPVIPFSLNTDWNVISRTIVPLIDQRDFPAAAMNESGLGDINASLFFRRSRRPLADGSGGRGRSSCCRRRPRTCSAPKNGASGRRAWP